MKYAISILSWQQSLWDRFQFICQSKRLPHALLFTGISGIGKKVFAEAWIASLLCDYPNEKHFACCACKSCCLFTARSHPDVLSIFPEEEGKVIKKEKVRTVKEFA